MRSAEINIGRKALRIGILGLFSMALCQAAGAQTTERVSLGSGGTEGNDASLRPSISGDGRFVAFDSDATNLVVGDSNIATDVFIHDRQNDTIERVSVASNGAEATDLSTNPSISADGLFVAFESNAANLFTGDLNGSSDIFVRDLQLDATERVSVATGGTEGNGASFDASISGTGRFVAFDSSATNLVGSDGNGSFDVFVHDRQLHTTERVSVVTGGAEATGGGSADPSISDDGRFVAFDSTATNLVGGDTNARSDVFVHDRTLGTTERVSVASGGAQATGGDSYLPSISADGRYVAFQSAATNLVGGDTNGNIDIFVHDRQLGTTMRVSTTAAGGEATGGHSLLPSVSPDGRFVSFSSYATNLVVGDGNHQPDIFAKNLSTGAIERVNVTSGGSESAGGVSDTSSMSAGGRYVAFDSYATNLVAGDTNFEPDVFVRDRGPQGMGIVVNDLVVDFGAAGMWQFLNNATWQKIHSASPTMMAVGDLDGSLQDEALASFTHAGLWARYNNSAWRKRHDAVPRHFLAADLDGNGRAELIADFGPPGIWARFNNTTWVKLHNGTSQALAKGDFDGDGREDLLVNFGGAGLWVRYGGGAWRKLHSASPKHIVTADLDGSGKAEAIADFGAAGIWARFNNTIWVKLRNRTSRALATGDLDGDGREDLLVDFGRAGLWARYGWGAWRKLHGASPKHIVTADLDGSGRAEAIIDFGGAGIWVLYNNATWMKLHNSSTEGFAVGGFD